jgi:hypothetical protein
LATGSLFPWPFLSRGLALLQGLTRVTRWTHLGANVSHEVSSPSAPAAPGVRYPRGFQPRHVPTSGFCTLMSVFSSWRLPSLFHPGSAHGVSPFKGFLLPRSCASFFRSTLPSWRFFPFASGSHGSTGDGRPRPVRLEFTAGPLFRLQGLIPPGNPCVTTVAFTMRRAPFPSWASSPPGRSPRLQRGQISPPHPLS